MIRLSRIMKEFPKKRIFTNLNIQFDNGNLYGIYGPSGCGKTTLLNMVSMLDFDYDGKINILIVDDAYMNRAVLSSILSNEYNVMEANGGQACIDALEKYGSKISLVLLDILMPDVDGFDVLKYMNIHHYLVKNYQRLEL